MADIWLPYGKTEVHVRISGENLVGVMEARDEPGVKDAAKEIEDSIDRAMLAKRLAEKAKPDSKIVLALNIPDAALAKLVVSSIIKHIEGVCVRSNLTVLFANNLLAPRTMGDVRNLVEEVSSLGVDVSVHDPEGDNVYVYETTSGVKVYLNRLFWNSDVRVVASIMEPNPYTMYNCCESGIALGLTGLETIKGILAQILEADDLQEKLFENSIEVSRAAKVDFCINIVRNKRNEVSGCFAGEPEEALRGGLSLADPMYKIAFRGEADIVIVSPGGAPFDDNIFNSCGCLENAIKVVRKNGVIILVAECPEGYGEQTFHRLVRRVNGDLRALEGVLKSDFSIGGFILYRLLRASKKASIFIVSAIPDYYSMEIPALRVFRVVNDALSYALDRFGAKSKVLVIPNGNKVIPVTKE